MYTLGLEIISNVYASKFKNVLFQRRMHFKFDTDYQIRYRNIDDNVIFNGDEIVFRKDLFLNYDIKGQLYL